MWYKKHNWHKFKEVDGLMAINPNDGTKDSTFPFKSDHKVRKKRQGSPYYRKAKEKRIRVTTARANCYKMFNNVTVICRVINVS